MIKSKKVNIIVAVAVVFALIVSFAFIGIGNIKVKNGTTQNEVEYASKIFGTDIISIEIIANGSDWQEMLDNARSEQYIMVDVIVNGTKFENVGIRTKGNSSLSQVASSDSDRYSFRLQFDEYIKGQTCFGLESFVVNNMISDNTYMKEYIAFDLMREAGVDTPYFGYADIKVNGENWGLYFAVELYNDSYEERVFGDTCGMLYNVKSMDMGGGNANPPGAQGGPKNMPNMQPPDMQGFDTQPPDMQGFGMKPPDMQDLGMQPPGMQDSKTSNSRPPMPDNGKSQQSSDSQSLQDTNSMDFSPQNPQSQMEDKNNGMGRNFGGRGFGTSGGSLEYVDDNTDSYSAIFNNVVGKGSKSDFKRVVKALKALSEGEDLETYFDVDQILRYLAAHTIVVNLDSYSSGMAQNYYLYERDGQVTILPWDYNLAWGGFQSGNASSVINFPIDTPVSGVKMSSRPLITKLFENPEYLERYHSYLQQLMDNYFADGKWEQKINTLDALISDYVKNDSTAFCTYEEYKSAISTLRTLGNLRAQSVQGQLDGTIPATTQEQKANPNQLISPGDLNLSNLGSMMGGRGDSNKMNFFGGNNMDLSESNNIDIPDRSRNMDFPKQINGEKSDDMTKNGNQQALPNSIGRMKQGSQNNKMSNRFNMRVSNQQGLETNNLILIGVLSCVLIVALLLVARFKKRY
jgi:hypothetical protein